MATKIYETSTARLIDGTEISLTPLKLKYLRDFLDAFKLVKQAESRVDSLERLSECVRIAMKQYCPRLDTVEQVQDNLDIHTMNEIINVAASISKTDEEKKEDKESEESSSWDTFDLAKVEAEAFLLGIWKDYEELEASMSLPELLATLEAKRDQDYADKKFMAALQGVDLDEQNGKKEDDPWEAMKARVFSNGQTSDPNDVLALQGVNAQKAGFGIGAGLSYEKWD